MARWHADYRDVFLVDGISRVLTIVGERLELSRLTGLAEQNRRSFVLSLAPFIAGLVVARQIPVIGLPLAGLGMFAMALWLGKYDLARRTVKQTGLTRFIAVNLRAGISDCLSIGPIRIGALQHFLVIRDLVIDMTDFLEKLERATPCKTP